MESTLYLTDPTSGDLLRRRWHLHVVDGPDRTRHAPIQESPALIGAAPAATLVLSDDAVSRYHAEIEAYADGLRVRDLDSTNGTFLEGEARVRLGFVENGGTFKVGATTIMVVAIDEPAASEMETDPSIGPALQEADSGLVAASPASQVALRVIRRVAPSSSSVLLHGPLGSGKGVLARLLHELGPRANAPFRALATGIAPPSSLGRLLFGTPGPDGEAGLFELAEGGTVYLEDVDLLPAPVQQELQAMLKTRMLVREPEAPPRSVTARLVAATSKDPSALSPGLLARIGQVRIPVLGFQDRPEDVAPLAEALLRRGLREKLRLGPATRALLVGRPFPRNLKDLEPLIARLLSMGHPPPNPFEAQLRAALLSDVVEQFGGHLGHAARALGVSERTLHAELKAAGVDLGL